MQVPAGTTVTTGAQNTPGDVSSTASTGSIFRSSAGAGKKSLLPAFAAILAQEAGDTNSGKEISGVAEQADAGKLPEESALGLGDEKFIPFASLLPLDGKSSNLPHAEQTSSVTTGKKVTGRRSESDHSSGVSVKKQSALTSVSESIPVAIPVMAVLPAAVQEKQTAQHGSVERLSPAATNLIAKPSSTSNSSGALDAANHKEEWNARETAVSSVETAASPSYPAKIDSSKADSAKTDSTKIEPQITSAALDMQEGEIAIPAAVANSIAHSIPENLPQGQKFSAEAKPASSSQAVDGMGAGAPAVSRVAGEVTAVQAPASKSKTQQKADGNAGSFSVNSVRAVSPRSNPGAAFAEFSPPANDAGSASAGKNTVPSDASPFQRLDSGETPATLLHSSAHQIAVGVHDPALGWLEVQTQSSAGHISATLTAASTDAHANLTAEMPAIAQYLADRNVPLHSLNVDTQGSAAGGGQSQQPGSGQQPQQELAGQSSHISQSGAQPLRGTAQDVSTTETVSASRISVRA